MKASFYTTNSPHLQDTYPDCKNGRVIQTSKKMFIALVAQH